MSIFWDDGRVGRPTREDDGWEWSKDRNANEKGISILVIVGGTDRGRYDLLNINEEWASFFFFAVNSYFGAPVFHDSFSS